MFATKGYIRGEAGSRQNDHYGPFFPCTMFHSLLGLFLLLFTQATTSPAKQSEDRGGDVNWYSPLHHEAVYLNIEEARS